MKQVGLASRLRHHPLLVLLKNNRGNPRTIILMEPLWGIPFNLIMPFATLYMYHQRISDVQIGLILSIAMLMQVLFSFLGGIITDKLGRKTANLLGDFVGWIIPCLIWAVSHNFWLFLIAALFNSFEQINQTAWFCLLVEDAEEKDLLGIYTWISIGGLIAVFFAPISGILIHNFTLVPILRTLYVIFAITMFIKALITYRYCRETQVGQRRKKEVKSMTFKQMFAEYKILIPNLIQNKELMKVVAIGIILHIANLISLNFFGLYLTQRLNLADRYLAFFPILNGMVMLIFMIVIQHRLEALKFKLPIGGGLALFAFCHLFLILMPIRNVPLVLVYVFLLAIANALVIPRRDALLQLVIDKKERARMMSLVVSSTIAFASPFGYLAGLLSSIDRRLPFVLTLCLFMVAILIVSRLRNPEVEVLS